MTEVVGRISACVCSIIYELSCAYDSLFYMQFQPIETKCWDISLFTSSLCVSSHNFCSFQQYPSKNLQTVSPYTDAAIIIPYNETMIVILSLMNAKIAGTIQENQRCWTGQLQKLWVVFTWCVVIFRGWMLSCTLGCAVGHRVVFQRGLWLRRSYGVDFLAKRKSVANERQGHKDGGRLQRGLQMQLLMS